MLVVGESPASGRYDGWAGKTGWETDYVVSRYPTPPHTIHPPYQIATILEESVIVLWRLQIPSNNVVHYMALFEAHNCSTQLKRESLSTPRPKPDEATDLW